MKIVKIGNHCCIRLCKQAIALSKKHQVHLIGFSKPTAGIEYLRTVTLCKHLDHLEEAIKLHADADVFHVHNEPSYYVALVKQVFPDKPVVLDVHDSMWFRSDEPQKQSIAERHAFHMADGFVFPSQACAEIIINKGLMENKALTVLPPYVNKMFYRINEYSYIGGIVYEGLVETDKGPEVMQYANFKDMAEKMKQLGLPFHIHSTWKNKEALEFYKDAFAEATYPFEKLIERMGHYDWGICGNSKQYQNWDVAMPNKLFEYMAAGLPIIALNCKSVQQFVEEHGVGIAVKSVEEIKERYDERAKCQANVLMKRNQFTMENKINLVERLYEKLIKEDGNEISQANTN